MYPHFSTPGPSEHIQKGPKIKTLSGMNMDRYNASASNRAKLKFMEDVNGSGAVQLYNKRSSLPSASSIAAFNRQRKKGWGSGGKSDMRTEEERSFNKSKKPSLSTMSLSRNHKVPDALIGSMINRAVISSVLDGSKKADAHRIRLMGFAKKLLEPLPDKKRNLSLAVFKASLNKLTQDPSTWNKKDYRLHFGMAKRALSGALPNLRLGRASPNSGLGESLDPNASGKSSYPTAPPSPISHSLMDAVSTAVPEIPVLNLAGRSKTNSKKYITSSRTKL